MSRSGYSDDLDVGTLNLYRGNVERAIKGKRGQSFLREMAESLDEMPVKELIVGELIAENGVCAIGAVCKARGLDVSKVDVYDADQVAKLVGISKPLAAEIEYLNDDYANYCAVRETPEERWQRMRQWIKDQVKP